VFDDEGRFVIIDARGELPPRKLELSPYPAEGDREMQATLHLGHLTATRTFHEVLGFAEFDGLAELFAELARDWRGWEGSRVWESADDDFLVVCKHDGIAGVRVEVTLRHHEEDWEVTSELFVELGPLDALARDVRSFIQSL
jgi:hypothetical protein